MNTGTQNIAQTTAALIESCKAGNEASFKELYQLYNKAMYNICMRMLSNREEAEDVLQESFISAFRNIDQYRGDAGFGAWLKKIVINRCIDVLKKRNFVFVPLEEKDFIEEEVDEQEPVNYEVDEILSAITLLPPGYRIILSLYLFEDYSHRMIAEKLSISEGTSKSQYARAKRKLVQLISKKRNG